MSIPSVFVILTSVAGFGSLMTCDILPIIDLGNMMNIGVTIALLVTYTLFPAMMMLFKKEAPVWGKELFDNDEYIWKKSEV